MSNTHTPQVAIGLTGPVVLCVLDGWGLSDAAEGNAIAQAKTPVYDILRATCPAATLTTHGPAVGLPEGQMGNSEVGHMNLGAGRVVWMDLPKIDKVISQGDFAALPHLQAHIAALRESGGVCHLMGLFSPGGVHAHQSHMLAAARVLDQAGIPTRIHLFTDGRDVPPQSALEYWIEVAPTLAALEHGHIASLTGRFYAMDRDNRWERVEAAYRAIACAEGYRATSVEDAIKVAYGRGETDEFISPTLIGDPEPARDGDGVLMLNFRTDRARELLAALGAPAFAGFTRQPIRFADMAGMVEYSTDHNAYMRALFPQEEIVNTLGAWLAAHDKGQFRLAETEKYPHVTFFFNGGIEEPYLGESRYMAPSPKVKTYDLKPQMAAPEVSGKLVEAIKSRVHDLIVVNFANPDMVGHTGDLAAAIAAVEAVDTALGLSLTALEDVGGVALVTADHGNCEMMIDPATGGPHTAHTTNPVPLFLVGSERLGGRSIAPGALCDIAPTLLEIMNIPQPTEMTGRSLLRRPGRST